MIDETVADTYARANLADKPIVFELTISKGLFAAEAIVSRLLTVQVGGENARCETTSTWTETWDVNWEFRPGQDTVQFKLRQSRSAMGGMMTCYLPDGTVTLPVPPGPVGTQEWTPLYVMPAELDVKRAFEYPFPGMSAASSSTIEFVFEEAPAEP